MADRKDSIKGTGDADLAKPPTQRCGATLWPSLTTTRDVLAIGMPRRDKTSVSKGLIVIPAPCSIPNERNRSLIPNTGIVKDAVKKEKKATLSAVSLKE